MSSFPTPPAGVLLAALAVLLLWLAAWQLHIPEGGPRFAVLGVSAIVFFGIIYFSQRRA